MSKKNSVCRQERENTINKYKLIYDETQIEKSGLSIKVLCEIASVSRSGYYAWLSRKDKVNTREEKDLADFQLILDAYKERGYDKGVMGIYMRLLRKGIRMNHKKIRRLMKKYELFCPVRKANPYRR
ncbi:TPA: IS3 family transposase, partial [Streptococcus pyogenes]|nr:IS3 family transposase [Streptococcus pyogenes]